jgi:protein phosphatase
VSGEPASKVPAFSLSARRAAEAADRADASAAIATRLAWSGQTDRGRVRPNNEDAFVAFHFNGRETHFLGKAGESRIADADFVFAVSDGMGGAKMGEFASRIAVQEITRLLPRSFRLSAGGMDNDFQNILTEVFEGVHHALLKFGWSYEECAGMGATLSLCWFTPRWMYFGHVGDTRVYYLPEGGSLKQITHDHSQVGWMRRNQKISEHEARTHPARHALQQALGAGHQFVDPHIGAVGYAPGDRFLICSDGLTEGLWDRRIEEMLRSPGPREEQARRLVEAAKAEAGRDNITAVVVEVLPASG